MMKSACQGPGLYDAAACNNVHVEEISVLDFEEMPVQNVDALARAMELDCNGFELIV